MFPESKKLANPAKMNGPEIANIVPLWVSSTGAILAC